MPATQIIAQGQVQQVGQPVSVAGTSAHLVKTVSTPVPLQLPTSTAVSINVTVPAQKTNIGIYATRYFINVLQVESANSDLLIIF